MKLSHLAFAGIGITASCLGDILRVQNTGNTPVPMHETEVEMLSEDVRIAPHPKLRRWYAVRCIFVLKSHSSVCRKMTMAFPISSPDNKHHFRDFRAEVAQQGAPFKIAPSRIRMARSTTRTDRGSDMSRGEHLQDALEYPGYLVWDVTFPPLGTMLVKCSYPMGEPARLPKQHPVSGWYIEYVVRTGALWRGNIGRATFTITFSENPRKPIGQERGIPRRDYDIRLSHATEAGWQSEKELCWTFTDWEPERDIKAAFVRWNGYRSDMVTANAFELPSPYRGSTKRYTDRDLTEVATADRERWMEYYPSRTALLDRSMIKAIAAEFLYYELFARHQDAFILCKPGELSGKGRLLLWGREDDHYVYSHWASYFRHISHRNGWYYPYKTRKTGDAILGPPEPTDPVNISELSPVEQENASFLQASIRNPLLRGATEQHSISSICAAVTGKWVASHWDALSVAPTPGLPDLTQEWTIPGLGMQFVPIEPGTFIMGSNTVPKAVAEHAVTISRAFLIGKHEVTQSEYRAIVGGLPSSLGEANWGRRRPVFSLDWYQAMSFCQQLTEIEEKYGRLPGGYVYRLPTEAEWEYCCRAGSSAMYCFGDQDGKLGEYGNYRNLESEQSQGLDTFRLLAPVGSLKPNGWGLFDLHGNASEWCFDILDPRQTDPATDPVGDPARSYRAVRGGSFRGFAKNCSSASRNWFRMGDKLNRAGLRVVLAQDMDLPQAPAPKKQVKPSGSLESLFDSPLSP